MPRRCRGIRGDVGIAPYGRSIEGAFGKTEGCGYLSAWKSEGMTPRFCYAS